MFGFMINQRNEHALEMLRQAHVNFDTAVWTADGHLLGYVLCFHHRLDDVNSEQLSAFFRQSGFHYLAIDDSALESPLPFKIFIASPKTIK